MRKSGDGLLILETPESVDAFAEKAKKHLRDNPGVGYGIAALHSKDDDADVIQRTLERMGEKTLPSIRPRLRIVPKDELTIHLVDDPTDPDA